MAIRGGTKHFLVAKAKANAASHVDPLMLPLNRHQPQWKIPPHFKHCLSCGKRRHFTTTYPRLASSFPSASIGVPGVCCNQGPYSKCSKPGSLPLFLEVPPSRAPPESLPPKHSLTADSPPSGMPSIPFSSLDCHKGHSLHSISSLILFPAGGRKDFPHGSYGIWSTLLLTDDHQWPPLHLLSRNSHGPHCYALRASNGLLIHHLL